MPSRRGEQVDSKHLSSFPADSLSQGLLPVWAESTFKSKYFSGESGRLCWWGPAPREPGFKSLDLLGDFPPGGERNQPLGLSPSILEDWPLRSTFSVWAAVRERRGLGTSGAQMVIPH